MCRSCSKLSAIIHGSWHNALDRPYFKPVCSSDIGISKLQKPQQQNICCHSINFLVNRHIPIPSISPFKKIHPLNSTELSHCSQSLRSVVDPFIEHLWKLRISHDLPEISRGISPVLKYLGGKPRRNMTSITVENPRYAFHEDHENPPKLHHIKSVLIDATTGVCPI